MAILSVFSEKMIGVETVQTVQAIGASIVLLDKIPNLLTPLSMLRYANGYNLFSGWDFSRVARSSDSTSLVNIGIEK